MAASADPKQISPKVLAAGLVGLLVTIIQGGVAALEPSAYEGLGVWAPIVSSGVTVGATLLAAWWKSDPLRVNTAAQLHTTPRRGSCCCGWVRSS